MNSGVEAVRHRPRTLLVAGAMLAALAVISVGSCRSPGGAGGAGSIALSRSPGVLQGQEPDVRVRVRQGVASVRIGAGGPIGVRALGSSGPTGPAAEMAPPLTIAGTPDGLKITDGKGASKEYFGPAGVQLSIGEDGMAPETDPKRWLRIDQAAYPGVLRVVPKPASRAEAVPVADVMGPPAPAGLEPGSASVLASAQPARGKSAPGKASPKGAPPAGGGRAALVLDVIEVVPIETYLMGVVPSEMFADWPLRAFQVQAVAARSYALQERSRSIALGQEFDLESSVLDQAYGGGTTMGKAREAVESTRGVVLTADGQLLRAYYSSTCGGRTASAADVWPTTNGFEFNLARPLQARRRESLCDGTKWSRWEVTRDRLQLTQRLRAWGARSGNRVREMGVLERVEVVRTNADDRPSRYRVTDERGRRFELSAEELRVACNVPVPGAPDVSNSSAENGRVRSGDVEFELSGPRVTIRGRGFGHGVGMCQYCARAFADRGDAWSESVLRFYPGARLERAY